MPAPDPPKLLRLGSFALRTAVGAGALLLAVAVFGFLTETRPTPIQREIRERIVTVRTVPVEPVPIARVWDGYGSAVPLNAADVAAQVSARVIERPEGVRPGAAVAMGDVLVRLDPTDFEQRVAWSEGQIASWEAQLRALDIEERRLSDRLELAQEQEAIEQRELDRLLAAQERGAGSASELERRRAQLLGVQRDTALLRQQVESLPARRSQLEATLAAERSNLEVAKENLRRATITAPISGVLQAFDADVGELLAVGTPVARIVDLTRIEAPLRLPAAARAEVSVGDDAELRTESGTTWRGRIVRIAPEIDPATRTFAAYVEVAQPGAAANPGAADLLHPGQFVAGRVVASAARPRVLVPRRAVDGGAVMLLGEAAEDGLARAARAEVEPLYNLEGRYPALDPVETQWTVLADGLQPGRRVIVSNLDEIRPGTLVRPATGGSPSIGEAAAAGATGAGAAGGGG